MFLSKRLFLDSVSDSMKNKGHQWLEFPVISFPDNSTFELYMASPPPPSAQLPLMVLFLTSTKEL
jgi:hypothetical protein